MRRKSTVWVLGSLAALALLYSASAGKAQPDSSSGGSLAGLEDVFAPGVFLEDRNGDGVVDFINARIVLPADAVPEEVAAAANIAARLGFESSAFTPGLAVLDSATSIRERTARRSSSSAARTAGSEQSRGGRPHRPVPPDAGAGTLRHRVLPLRRRGRGGGGGSRSRRERSIAANSASARLPYLWQLRSDTRLLGDGRRRGVPRREPGGRGRRPDPPRRCTKRARSRSGRLVMTLDVVDPGNAAEVLDELAADHRVGQARFTDRRAVRLSYYGAGALDFQLPRRERGGRGPVRASLQEPFSPRTPGRPKAANR